MTKIFWASPLTPIQREKEGGEGEERERERERRAASPN
jgi:hypothetical protein